MESREQRKFKILKSGQATFFIKSIETRAKIKNGTVWIEGGLLKDKNGFPYVKLYLRVTDSDGVSESVIKLMFPKNEKDILKFLKCIGRQDLNQSIFSPDFNWDELEDEHGYCWVEKEVIPIYGERNIISSFIKKPMKYDMRVPVFTDIKKTASNNIEVNNEQAKEEPYIERDQQNNMMDDEIPF